MVLNDYELLYYCYQNNEYSFNLLAEKYRKCIYYVINLMKNKFYFSTYDDDDLYNEGLILLYECVYSYQEMKNIKFSSYYIACLKNRYTNIVRILLNNKNKALTSASSLDYNNNEQSLHEIIEDKRYNIKESVINNYIIDDTVKFLGDNMNEIELKIIYSYLRGYSYNEISVLHNIKIKKIDNSIYKYKKLLKK